MKENEITLLHKTYNHRNLFIMLTYKAHGFVDLVDGNVDIREGGFAREEKCLIHKASVVSPLRFLGQQVILICDKKRNPDDIPRDLWDKIGVPVSWHLLEESV